MSRVTPFVVAWLLAMVGAAHAQILTGNIIGTVKDESGAVLPGVTVTLTSPALPGGPLTTVTNGKGEYRFTQLDPGSYALTITLVGFSTYQEEGLRVAVSGTTERAVALKLATVAETITVSGESPMVDPRKVGVTTNFSQEVLEVLPTKRNTMTEYVKWAPGVSAGDPSGDGGAVAVMGSGTGENSILLDGVMANAPTGGGNWSSSDMDAVEEIQVVTLGASAEYQVAQGGVFNVVFKQGTNQFRYDALAYWHPDSLISKPIQVNCNCSLGKTGFTTVRFRDYTAHAGGPIIKDRVWFYAGGNYYGKIVANPGIDPRLPLLRRSHALFAKVTWQMNDRLKFRQTYQVEPWENPGTPTPARPHASSTAIGGKRLTTYASELTATITNSTLLIVRATGWTDPDDYTKPLSGDRITPYRIDQRSGIACCGVQSFGVNDLGRHGQAVKLSRYIQGARIEHDIRVGVQLEEAYSHNFSAFPSGVQYSDLGGAPDQATFRAPFVSGAESTSQAIWAENQMILAGRVTLSLGARYDRMRAISPDLPAVNNLLQKTGATIQGLGDMFTWNVVSPRLGFNLKLTRDGKTIIRGNYGRAYRPIFLNEFSNVHPGISPTTLARYNPATGGYTTIISVTDPLANIAVDTDMDAPFTDQFSVGADHELMPNLGIGVTYIHKNGKKQIGWKDIGGVYGTRTEVLPDGRTVAVSPLLNATSARKFLRTNGPGFFTRYDGLVLAMNKRWSQRWQANVAYTYSKAEGLAPGGNTGQDPNDYVNLGGRLSPQDRPHMFVAVSTVEVPRIDVQVSTSFMGLSGTPFAPQALVQLPQGRRSVNIETPGSYRQSSQELLYFRFNKLLFRRGNRRLELGTEIRNVLQDEAELDITTSNFFSPTFAQPAQWIEPRQMYFWAKVLF